jgi:hypothetical protein
VKKFPQALVPRSLGTSWRSTDATRPTVIGAQGTLPGVAIGQKKGSGMRNLFDRGSSPLFPALAPLTPQTDAGPVAMVRLVAHASSTVGVLLARGTNALPDSSPPSVWLRLRLAPNYAHMPTGEPKHSRQQSGYAVQLPRSADSRIN